MVKTVIRVRASISGQGTKAWAVVVSVWTREIRLAARPRICCGGRSFTPDASPEKTAADTSVDPMTNCAGLPGDHLCSTHPPTTSALRCVASGIRDSHGSDSVVVAASFTARTVAQNLRKFPNEPFKSAMTWSFSDSNFTISFGTNLAKRFEKFH